MIWNLTIIKVHIMPIKKTILKLNLYLKATYKIGCSLLVERELQSIFLILFNGTRFFKYY